MDEYISRHFWFEITQIVDANRNTRSISTNLIKTNLFSYLYNPSDKYAAGNVTIKKKTSRNS